MLAVLNPDETVTAVMSGAAATTNPTYQVLWGETGSPTTNHSQGSLNGSSAVTLVSSKTAGTREVERVILYNGDTASVTVTIAKTSGGTSYPLAKVALPVGAMLRVSGDGISVIDSSGQSLQSSAGAGGTVGTVAANVSAVESGDLVRKTVLTMTDVSVTVANTTGVSFGGTKIYDFPAGRILLLGVTAANISFGLTDEGNATPIDGDMGGDIAIGSTAPDDGTLTDTDVDILPSTSIDPISDGVDGAALAASAQFDGTTTPLDAYFNILIDDADVEDEASDVLLVSGTVTMHWILLGDY